MGRNIARPYILGTNNSAVSIRWLAYACYTWLSDLWLSRKKRRNASVGQSLETGCSGSGRALKAELDVSESTRTARERV